MSKNDQIAILLCTFNGCKYLREQLDSIINQTHKNWILYVSDDGSTDGTLDILGTYQKVLETKLKIFDGPRQGFARNFLSLIQHSQVDGDFFAFCDQDDIWLENKLSTSLAAIQHESDGTPTLYCARTKLIGPDGRDLGYSPLFTKPPSFRNALVQSLAGANTMLINRRTRALLALTEPNLPVVAHDWLTYLIVSGYNGVIVFDSTPTILYRQHGENLIGSKMGFKHRFKRLTAAIKGRFSDWNEMNIRLMNPHRSNLSEEHRQILEYFERARESALFQRLRLLANTGVYRQTLGGNLSLLMAAALKKI
ncbi:glycosyltransferase family 2 protein [Pseudomonas plecoglossicida]|uniref:glycosyltransferase family 2 protein n=1 Tax=Pseudomonas TaxID=286 RepID=UPI000761CDAD|nr:MULTISPECIES: glycosyltransferase family 2 protein [Pseudomonas]MDN5520896.1 glycosyltransferase family 2 protein [Pseudomonas sp.]MDQ7966993.1 glycosyltransferase family 2 protein [Pseudomonas plecoglossicida]WBM45406.1 glycosyltransferase family 2 protein [Pseudomonas putida]WFG01761.1 glycosyltransferase family 2 protein [Pseudomonas putida]HDS0940195.1 glycosyltransferase family 2 protein [Pseudomonas putida]